MRRLETDKDYLCWQVRLKDRFADHGMIAVVIVHKADDAWRIETWLQSCRVLRRGVEEALMNRLATVAAETGATLLEGDYRPTARNGLVRDFYPRMGFALVHSDDAAQAYRVRTDDFRGLKSFVAEG